MPQGLKICISFPLWYPDTFSQERSSRKQCLRSKEKVLIYHLKLQLYQLNTCSLIDNTLQDEIKTLNAINNIHTLEIFAQRNVH